jgi:hypothetical protein
VVSATEASRAVRELGDPFVKAFTGVRLVGSDGN